MSVFSQKRHFMAIFAFLHPFYTFFSLWYFSKGNSSYYTFCLFMVYYLFFFIFPDHPIFLSYTLISLTLKQRTNKQQKRNNSNVLPLIAAGFAVTTHCHVYKGTHGICYWLAPNLILNKRTCYSSQFFP